MINPPTPEMIDKLVLESISAAPSPPPIVAIKPTAIDNSAILCFLLRSTT